MTGADAALPADGAAPGPGPRASKPFRRRSDAPRLSSDEAARQGRAARLAWEALPEPGAAVAFLNAHHERLGGRPIDLAVASPEGLRAVEQAIARLTRA